ncbi:MAG: bifunctional 4-hydroxy-2-oxoglutarate aldolase/2-dehydro-3-deoxy-phosphogluconate aldolase [Deltaproteobacteria bacterium]
MSWTKESALKKIREVGLIPIVRTPSAEDALRAAEAILASGIGIAEITMTVPSALSVIERVAMKFGDQVLLGAGTIVDAPGCESAISAGAQFIVTPALTQEVIETAIQRGKPCFPGALTPTEILAAWRAGADMVKVFPCGPVGGAKYIRAIRGPFPDIPLVPTGGVNLENAADLIRAGAAAIAVGGELVDLRALRSGNLNSITSTAKKFLHAVRAGRAAAAPKAS